ncbi:MAG: transporter substrate-binding domain-containing protein [Parvibaculaceae bacterium]
MKLLGSATAVLTAPACPAVRGGISHGVSSPAVLRRRRIKVGLLWSLSGHLSVIEKPSRDVALFWIDEANRNGGVAGAEIEPVIIDTNSDMKAYRAGILKLMLEEQVLATFGGYTSASRRAIMPLVTMHDGLFYYPTCYEGLECWQQIIFTGPIANQHSIELNRYMVRNHGNRAYFIGSNYVWAKESNRNASRWLADIGGELVSERYVPLGSGVFDDILDDIKRRAPDWIFSTIVGDSDIYLRREYVRAGFTPDRLPTASLTTSELEVRTLGAAYGEGHILCAPYFQSLPGGTNKRFVENFLASRFGQSGVTHYNMEETYLAFQYFRKAVERLVAEEGFAALTPMNVRKHSGGLLLSDAESPEGEVQLDPASFNSWLKPKIGRFNRHGQIDLLWQREENMPPMPYLLYPERGICLPDGLHLPDGTIVKAAS